MSSSFDGYSAIASGFATGISANGYGFQASSSPDGGISFSFDPSNNGGYGYGAHVFAQNPTPYGKAHSGIPGGGYKPSPSRQQPTNVPRINDEVSFISRAEYDAQLKAAINAYDYAVNPHRRRMSMLCIIAFFPITLPMLAIEHIQARAKNSKTMYSNRPDARIQPTIGVTSTKLMHSNRPF